MNDKLIKIRNICKSYGENKVLENLSCDFEKEKVNFIMGPSGRGKTTLLRIMMGLEKADSGSIEGMENMTTAVVFQENRLCENLSAIANIRMVNSGMSNIQKLKFIDEIEKALERSGLGNSGTVPVCNLSGGMKRRVAVLRGVMANREVIFMDEPLKGLDRDSEEMFMKVVAPYLQGKTVFWVTHREEESMYFDNVRFYTI